MPLSLAGYGGGVGSLSIKINTNLILHLDADDSSSYSGSGTTWTDISGKNHNATLAWSGGSSGPAYNSDNGIGSIVFDGTNHYAVLDSSFQVSTSRTYSFEAWIYKTTNAANNAAILISGGSGGDKDGIIITSEHYWNTDVDISSEGGPVNAIYYNGVSQPLNGANTRSTATYNLNEWIHIAVTGITVNNTDGGAHHIAQNNNNSNKFGGRIRSLKVYEGELTASEVQQNYLKSRFIVTNNLLFNLDAGDSNSYSGSGNIWTDISGQGNHGTLKNTPTYQSQQGGVFNFNGSNEWVDMEEKSDFGLGTTPFTVEMWFYRVNGNQPLHGSLLSLTRNVSGGNTDASTFQFMCHQTDSFKIKMSIRNDDNTVSNHIFDTAIPAETWTHVVYVKEGTGANQCKCYINGVVESSTYQNNSNMTNSNPRIQVGANRARNYFHKGKISQVRIYKGKGLTSSEVTQNYNAMKGRFGL